jgi:PleD family two-component response regulator
MYLADDVMAITNAPLTCLIVDDSAFMRFHLRRMMDSFEGVIASEAANGNEAIREYGRLIRKRSLKRWQPAPSGSSLNQ